jgi:Uma2 family endonuclease
MSTILTSSTDFPPYLPLRRFSTEKYLQMVAAGVLGPEDKVELIGGVIVDMSPAGIPHNHFLINIVELFSPLLATHRIAVQATLPLGVGQVFDPDFMLLRRTAQGYKHRYPQPADVLLLIEAAESSLRRDREVKLPVYAAAGIQEYWIADLDREQVLVHRDPAGEVYRTVSTHSGEESLNPQVAPEFSVTVQQLFA